MTAQSRKPNVESGRKIAQCADHAAVHSAFRFRSSAFPRGLTLVELLITMTIMAIIAAMILGTAQAAMESSRRARTQQTIHKIHSLIMERLESYSTRRVDSVLELALNAAFPGPANARPRGEALADIRLLSLREMMKYEMPDRWSDVTDNPLFLASRPSLAQSYLARFNQISSNNPVKSFEGPECLYMTVMYATGDGEARTLFTKQEIGDADGDGAPEFLDGWGQPIGWLRWPAGFLPHSQLMTGDANTDHDSFDMYRRDQPGSSLVYPSTFGLREHQQCLSRLRDANSAFRLVPLIYSVGPDGASDISTTNENGTSDAIDTSTPKAISLDPYALVDPSQPPNLTTNQFIFGVERDVNNDGYDNSKDNIHNHLLEK